MMARIMESDKIRSCLERLVPPFEVLCQNHSPLGRSMLRFCWGSCHDNNHRRSHHHGHREHWVTGWLSNTDWLASHHSLNSGPSGSERFDCQWASSTANPATSHCEEELALSPSPIDSVTTRSQKELRYRRTIRTWVDSHHWTEVFIVVLIPSDFMAKFISSIPFLIFVSFLFLFFFFYFLFSSSSSSVSGPTGHDSQFIANTAAAKLARSLSLIYQFREEQERKLWTIIMQRSRRRMALPQQQDNRIQREDDKDLTKRNRPSLQNRDTCESSSSWPSSSLSPSALLS